MLVCCASLGIIQWSQGTLRQTGDVLQKWSSNFSPTHSIQSTGRTEVLWIHNFQLSCTAEKYQDFQGFLKKTKNNKQQEWGNLSLGEVNSMITLLEKLMWQPNTEHDQCWPLKDILIMVYFENLRIQEQYMKSRRTANMLKTRLQV